MKDYYYRLGQFIAGAVLTFIFVFTLCMLVVKAMVHIDCYSSYSESKINHKVVGMACLLQTEDGTWLPPSKYFNLIEK